jgi:DNA-binding transcriptional MerR regulator
MDDDAPPLSIGELAKRTGLPVRTIRFWSDIGVLPPAGRTTSSRRLYDAACVARLELIVTLRELGLGLADVRRVLDSQATVAEVAAVHLEALDAQIRTLRLRRGVLAAAVKRAADGKEVTIISKLARLSVTERSQIIGDFTAEVFHGLEPSPGGSPRWAAGANMPDDPSPEQIEAWVELAEMARDPDFREHLRQVTRFGMRVQAGHALLDLGRAEDTAESARNRGVPPDSAEAARVVDDILADTAGSQQRAELLAQLKTATDPRAERYWHLTATINGWPPFRSPLPAIRWLAAALHARQEQRR